MSLLVTNTEPESTTAHGSVVPVRVDRYAQVSFVDGDQVVELATVYVECHTATYTKTQYSDLTSLRRELERCSATLGDDERARGHPSSNRVLKTTTSGSRDPARSSNTAAC
jgi:hypothetical protein